MSGFAVKPILYRRYIDDIFFIWPGNVNELLQFELFLNSLIKGIKLTFTYSYDSVKFLDTIVYVYDLEQRLKTKVFFKPTDSHSLLSTNSFHPKHTFNGILKSQFKRYKSICQNRIDYIDACETLITSLARRGYNLRKMRILANNLWMNELSIKPMRHDNIIYFSIIYGECGKAIAKTAAALAREHGIYISTAWRTNRNLGAILRRRL